MTDQPTRQLVAYMRFCPGCGAGILMAKMSEVPPFCPRCAADKQPTIVTEAKLEEWRTEQLELLHKEGMRRLWAAALIVGGYSALIGIVVGPVHATVGVLCLIFLMVRNERRVRRAGG